MLVIGGDDMKNIKIQLNAIRQKLVGTVHIIQGHVRKDGHRIPDEVKEDLELSITTLNSVVEELSQINREN